MRRAQHHVRGIAAKDVQAESDNEETSRQTQVEGHAIMSHAENIQKCQDLESQRDAEELYRKETEKTAQLNITHGSQLDPFTTRAMTGPAGEACMGSED